MSRNTAYNALFLHNVNNTKVTIESQRDKEIIDNYQVVGHMAPYIARDYKFTSNEVKRVGQGSFLKVDGVNHKCIILVDGDVSNADFEKKIGNMSLVKKPHTKSTAGMKKEKEGEMFIFMHFNTKSNILQISEAVDLETYKSFI